MPKLPLWDPGDAVLPYTLEPSLTGGCCPRSFRLPGRTGHAHHSGDACSLTFYIGSKAI